MTQSGYFSSKNGNHNKIQQDSSESGSESETISFINIFKEKFGETNELYEFEKNLIAQREELKIFKEKYEIQRIELQKCQDEKRSLEFQRINEKSILEQELRNASALMEKNEIPLQSQIHSLKCEVESYKIKLEANAKESVLIKEQLKIAEGEKNEALQNVSELLIKVANLEKFRNKIENYTKRQRECMDDLKEQFESAKKGKEHLEKLIRAVQKEMEQFKINLDAQKEVTLYSEKKSVKLEQQLAITKAEAEQTKHKLIDIALKEFSSISIINRLKEENNKLRQTLQKFSITNGNEISNKTKNLLLELKKINE